MYDLKTNSLLQIESGQLRLVFLQSCIDVSLQMKLSVYTVLFVAILFVPFFLKIEPLLTLLIIICQGPPGERGQDGLPGDPVSFSSPFYKLY